MSTIKNHTLFNADKMIVKILKLINQVIQSDIKNLRTLKSLHGTVLTLKILDLNFAQVFYFTEQGIQANTEDFLDEKNTFNIQIQGDLKDFLTLLISKDARRATTQGLSFSGDPKSLQGLQSLLLNLAIDWAAVFEPWFDEYFLYHNFLKPGFTFLTSSIQSESKLETLKISIRDYLEDELDLLPRREQVEQFINEVDLIRSAVERAEARISLLGVE